MKSNIVRVSILALGAVAAYAQTVSPVRAYIPFEFSVGGANMPAGAYRVDLNVPNVVILHAVDSGAHATALTRADAVLPQEGAKLVFHRFGDQYFLAEVSSMGTYTRLVPITKQERNLAKGDNSPDRTPERVIVAAR